MADSNVIPVAVATGTADVAHDGKQRLYGWWFQESAATGAVAELIIRDGTDNTGEIIARLEFTANENKEPFAFPWPQGLRIDKGVFIDRVSGETQGTIFVG